MTTLLDDLASKVEALTAPCRDTDAEIAVALGHKITTAMTNYTMESFPAIEWQAPHPYAGMKEPCPSWTASLDAASTLVPRDTVPLLRKGTWWHSVEVWPHESTAHVAYENGDAGIIEEGAKATTPAIALVAAALRVRAAIEGFS